MPYNYGSQEIMRLLRNDPKIESGNDQNPAVAGSPSFPNQDPLLTLLATILQKHPQSLGSMQMMPGYKANFYNPFPGEKIQGDTSQNVLLKRIPENQTGLASFEQVPYFDPNRAKKKALQRMRDQGYPSE